MSRKNTNINSQIAHQLVLKLIISSAVYSVMQITSEACGLNVMKHVAGKQTSPRNSHYAGYEAAVGAGWTSDESKANESIRNGLDYILQRHCIRHRHFWINPYRGRHLSDDG